MFDFWKKDKIGKMNLAQAVHYVAQLKKKGKDVNVTDKDGNTVLARFPEAAGELILLGVDANIPNNKGDIPLVRSARSNWFFPLGLIEATSKENLNKHYSDGETILTALLKNNEYFAYGYPLDKILSAGADPDMPNKKGERPIDLWAEKERNEALENFNVGLILCKHGADISDVVFHGDNGYSAPMIMTMMLCVTNPGRYKILMDAMDRTDLSVKDNNGNTLLISWAVNFDYVEHAEEVFDKLIKSGIDINARNDQGLTALNFAIRKGSDIFGSPERDEYIAILLNAGADIMIPDHSLKTPLHYASQNAMGNLIVDLIQRGADVNALDADGKKPSDYAANKVIKEYLKIQEKSGPQITRVISHTNGLVGKETENTRG